MEQPQTLDRAARHLASSPVFIWVWAGCPRRLPDNLGRERLDVSPPCGATLFSLRTSLGHGGLTSARSLLFGGSATGGKPAPESLVGVRVLTRSGSSGITGGVLLSCVSVRRCLRGTRGEVRAIAYLNVG